MTQGGTVFVLKIIIKAICNQTICWRNDEITLHGPLEILGKNMIIATVKLKGRGEKRREIIQTISGLGDQVRKIKGCSDVNSYQDINDQDVFYHVEKWQTQKDLDEYLSSKLFAALLGIRTILVEKPTVEFMKTENSTTVEKI
jgi:quinol monooxygenase YgiN